MKVDITPEMKRKITVIAIGFGLVVLFLFVLQHVQMILDFALAAINLLSPFLLGIAFAFLLYTPTRFLERKVFSHLPLKAMTRRSCAAISSVVLGILVVLLFFAIIIPELVRSVSAFVNDFPQYMERTYQMGEKLLGDLGFSMEEVSKALGDMELTNRLAAHVSAMIPALAEAGINFAKGIVNVLIAIVSALYILIDREKLIYLVKRITYAFVPAIAADYLSRLSNDAYDIFNKFIVGKAIDSTIIGILCYIGMLIIGLPYAAMLSVFVGITNMIPVFGPFIGAIPGAVILFMADPWYCLYFVLFILALQQFDGNILGPLILGDKLGLSGIWILFSVCVGGGMFGILGMFIGVPAFALLYAAVRDIVDLRLKQKQIRDSDLKLQSRKEAS